MSSRKNNLQLFQNITNGNMGSTVTSAITNISWLDNVGCQLNFIGTPTGTFSVLVSADYAQDNNGNVTSAGNWTPITLSPVPVASGTAGTVFIDLNQLAAPWIQVVYTPSSSSGTLNGFITGKMI